MKIRVFTFKKRHPVILEIREIKSDKNEDPLIHFVPPLSNPEIIFYIGNRSQIKNVNILGGFIKGQYTIPQKIDFNPGYHFLSIVLYPYGLKQLFNINANELVNSVIDVKENELALSLLEIIHDKVEIDVSVINQINDTIAQFNSYPVSFSTKEFIRLIEENDSNNITSLIKGKAIELRTLQRNFKKEVGLTPKQFLRIVRINKIERQVQENIDFMQIVADYDFSDQSHLIKEFKSLRSLSPQEMKDKKLFLSDQLPSPNVVLV